MSTTNVPTDLLELRAAEQRKRLHNSAWELRQELRARLDLRRNARQYLLPAAGVIGVVGLALGYGVAGIFTGS